MSEFLIQIPTETPAWESLPAVAIATPEDYGLVAERLKVNKAFQKSVAEFFKPMKAQADAAHKAVVAAERKLLEPAQADEARDKGLLIAYDAEQDRLRRDAERRAQEAARKAEEERRLAEAAALETLATATGDAAMRQEAEALIAAPIEVPVVAVEKATPKVAGITYVEKWSAVVVSKQKFVEFVAQHPDYLHLLDVNMTAVNGLARAMKGAMKIPGVQATATKSVAAGR